MAKSKAAGRTRWKRFGLALIPATVVISGLGMAAANGAIPMSFAVSGVSFKVAGSHMDAHDVIQYGDLTNRSPGNQTAKPVILSGFKTANFKDLCQSVKLPLPWSIMGHDSVVMKIESPTAEAENMIADLAEMTGDATFKGVDIGIDAASATRGPISVEDRQYVKGQFGQQVQDVIVENPRQTVYAVSASTFHLGALKLSVNFDNKECF